jgi:hypothetical protein
LRDCHELRHLRSEKYQARSAGFPERAPRGDPAMVEPTGPSATELKNEIDNPGEAR